MTFGLERIFGLAAQTHLGDFLIATALGDLWRAFARNKQAVLVSGRFRAWAIKQDSQVEHQLALFWSMSLIEASKFNRGFSRFLFKEFSEILGIVKPKAISDFANGFIRTQ